MCSRSIVIVDVLFEQSPEVVLIKWNHVVEKFSPTTADPPFSGSILPRALKGNPDGLGVKRLYCFNNFRTEDGISIEDEILGSRIKRECFTKLLHDPFGRWTFSDVEMDQLPSLVVEDKENIEQAKGHSRNDEEIHGGDGFTVIAKKGEPILKGASILGAFGKISGHRSL